MTVEEMRDQGISELHIIEQAARTTYEVNRAYARSIGDHSFGPWDDAPEWQKDTNRAGIQFHLDNPGATPADSHASWMLAKLDDGWVYGPTKDPVNKRHPCLLPYEQLPREQQVKDDLFIAVMRGLTG